jgi:hypothetical protein
MLLCQATLCAESIAAAKLSVGWPWRFFLVLATGILHAASAFFCLMLALHAGVLT